MIKVLIITGLLPVSIIEKKKSENDILLVTENEIKKNYNDIRFEYIFTFPYVNKSLSFFSLKWTSYLELKKQKSFFLRGRKINALSIISLPRKFIFRHILYEVSFWLNRNYINDIIKQSSPTVIHAHNVHGDAYFARKISLKYNIPYVVTLRGLNNCTDKIVKNSIKDARTLIAISPTQKKMAEYFVGKSVDLIPHGIEEQFFIKKEIGNREKPIKCVVVCRLLKLKNIDKVIKAFSHINHNYIFHIYGEGPEKENLQSLINKLNLSDRIKVFGFISHYEMPQNLAEYDLFIMPSFPESLGRVFFEAMACGLPVIGAKNTGIDGLIKDGVEGFLIDHNNEASLGNKLELIFQQPELLGKMGGSAVKLAKQFTWRDITEKLYRTYKI